MSSFRNAVKRKTHKERAQPESRKRFGLLEKHKDYVERARDYNKKKKRIQALQEKAAFRNPDEFYMKMQNMATKRGVHANLGEDSIDADTLKLFKTQDLSYVTLKKQSEQTKIGEGCAVGVCAARGFTNAPIGRQGRGRALPRAPAGRGARVSRASHPVRARAREQRADGMPHAVGALGRAQSA